jgi:hypothetical protein
VLTVTATQLAAACTAALGEKTAPHLVDVGGMDGEIVDAQAMERVDASLEEVACDLVGADAPPVVVHQERREIRVEHVRDRRSTSRRRRELYAPLRVTCQHARDKGDAFSPPDRRVPRTVTAAEAERSIRGRARCRGRRCRV